VTVRTANSQNSSKPKRIPAKCNALSAKCRSKRHYLFLLGVPSSLPSHSAIVWVEFLTDRRGLLLRGRVNKLNNLFIKVCQSSGDVWLSTRSLWRRFVYQQWNSPKVNYHHPWFAKEQKPNICIIIKDFWLPFQLVFEFNISRSSIIQHLGSYFCFSFSIINVGYVSYILKILFHQLFWIAYGKSLVFP